MTTKMMFAAVLLACAVVSVETFAGEIPNTPYLIERDGVLYKDGRPYHGVGYNFFFPILHAFNCKGRPWYA